MGIFIGESTGFERVKVAWRGHKRWSTARNGCREAEFWERFTCVGTALSLNRSITLFCLVSLLNDRSADGVPLYPPSDMPLCRFDVAALNFRGCSGQLSKYPVGYHLGFTDDLLHVVRELILQQPETMDYYTSPPPSPLAPADVRRSCRDRTGGLVFGREEWW